MTQTARTASTAVSSTRPAREGTSPSSASGAFRLGLVVLVVTTVVWRYWTLRSWSWFQDDWIYLARTAQLPFWEYVTQNYNGHVMPGQFVLAWAITKIGPLDYSLAIATSLLFIVASLLAWAAALRAIFGERARLLYPLVVLALSPLFMPISLWWAAALQTFPLQLFMGLSVLFTARYLRSGSRRDVAGLVVSYALGLFFWQKALLIAIPVVFVAMLLTTGSLGERLSAAWRIGRFPMAVAAAYVPLYLWFTRSGDDAATELFEKRTVGQTLDFFLTGILDVGIPALLGGPWQSLSEPQQVFGSSSGVLTLAFLGLTVLAAVFAARYRRGGGLAVGMAVVYASASWGLLFTSSRFDMIGVFLVRDARYAADILPVALLTATFIITPTRTESRSTWLKGASDLVRPWARAVRPIGVAGLVFVAGSTLYSSGRIWDAMSPQTPKHWVDNLTTDAAISGIGPIHDSNAPDHVIFSVYFPEEARISNLLRPLSPALRFNEPAEHLLIPDSAGRLVEVDVEPSSRSASPPPVEGCGYLVNPGQTTVIPLETALYNWEWGYQLSYFSGQPAMVTVATESKSVDVPIAKGLHQVQFIVEDSAARLRVTGHPDSSPVCITEAHAGPLTASDRRVSGQGQP